MLESWYVPHHLMVASNFAAPSSLIKRRGGSSALTFLPDRYLRVFYSIGRLISTSTSTMRYTMNERSVILGTVLHFIFELLSPYPAGYLSYFTVTNPSPFLACFAALFNACSSVSVHLTLNWSHFLTLNSLLNVCCIFCNLDISLGSPEPL